MRWKSRAGPDPPPAPLKPSAALAPNSPAPGPPSKPNSEMRPALLVRARGGVPRRVTGSHACASRGPVDEDKPGIPPDIDLRRRKRKGGTHEPGPSSDGEGRQ